MTCVIAIKEDGKVYMGADSAGTGGDFSQRTRNDSKLCKVGPFMFGFTTSFRMGQLLAHSFIAPDRDPRVSVEKFMSTLFIDSIRSCLKAGGFATKDNDAEVGGQFLVAYEGRVFQIYNDYQVAESVLDYEAIGCGSDIAMGSLHTSGQHTTMWPKGRIVVALEAAEEFSAGVRGPFVFDMQA
jgi:ATP-dependent protease HslVU (ClpYQ) peptidase subunit